jgi:acyl-CoA synthetase (AMP-forming)/AMP-acid ligase II
MNIAEILHAHALESPAAAAIIDHRGRRTTFAELDHAAACAAGLLWQNGVRPGDAVLVFHPMSAELYVALAALFRLRLTAVFLDPSAGKDHIERSCAVNPPKVLIAGARAHLLRLWSPAVRRIPVKFVIGPPLPGATRWSRRLRTPPHSEIVACEADTPALLTFTSGSTGEPRAALRSHGFLRAQHRVLAKCLALVPGDIDLTTLPIVLLANLASGVTSVIPNADLRAPGAIDAGPVIAQMRTNGVTSSAGSPAFFERVTQHCAAQGMTLPTLRKLFSGGAPVFARLHDEMQTMAPAAEIVALYGSTEAEPIASLSRSHITSDDRQAMRSGHGVLAGTPVEAIRLRILPDRWGAAVGPFTAAEFAAQCVGREQAGEIVVSGAHVLPGYLHGHGDDATKFRVGADTWHRTGDAGYLDAQGRLWLLGRCAARLDDSRGTLYPLPVEAAASEYGQIRRSALVAHAGRRVLAVELCNHAGPDLAPLKRDLSWAQLDDLRPCRRLPVDARHNAKIDYVRLFRMLEAS